MISGLPRQGWWPRPAKGPIHFATGRRVRRKFPWLDHAYGAHFCVACAKLLHKGRIYLYFNALHIDSLGLIPPVHLRKLRYIELAWKVRLPAGQDVRRIINARASRPEDGQSSPERSEGPRCTRAGD